MPQQNRRTDKPIQTAIDRLHCTFEESSQNTASTQAYNFQSKSHYCIHKGKQNYRPTGLVYCTKAEYFPNTASSHQHMSHYTRRSYRRIGKWLWPSMLQEMSILGLFDPSIVSTQACIRPCIRPQCKHRDMGHFLPIVPSCYKPVENSQHICEIPGCIDRCKNHQHKQTDMQTRQSTPRPSRSVGCLLGIFAKRSIPVLLLEAEG